MGTVELTFSALPAHVRTARLIAAAVARRTGVDEALLDEVRLAVDEACSRAVEAHRRHCPAQPIRLEFRDDSDRFEVVVTDTAPTAELNHSELPALPVAPSYGTGGGYLAEALPPGFGLAVIAGLADDVEVAATPAGLRVRMSWAAKGNGVVHRL